MEPKLRVLMLSGACVLDMKKEESLELTSADLASQLEEPLRVSAYRLDFSAGGRKLGQEVLADLWPEPGDLDLQVLVQPIDTRRCPLIQPGKILEVHRDGAMRVSVTFQPGHVLERDAEKLHVVHKVVIKDPPDFFPAPQAVFLYDEQLLPSDGSKTLRISLLGPPFGDLGRRTQGRAWPYGLQELMLHFSIVHLETGAGTGKSSKSPTQLLEVARKEGVARLLWILGSTWLLHVANLVSALWLTVAAFKTRGSLYGALVLLSLGFPGILWQMLCRPGRLVWLEYDGSRICNMLLFICSPLGMLIFVYVTSTSHVCRLARFLLQLRRRATATTMPVNLKHWYIYEAFWEDTRVFGDLPRTLLCAFSLLNRLVLKPMSWADMDMVDDPEEVAPAEVISFFCSAAAVTLGLFPQRRQVSQEAKRVVIQHILHGLLR